MNGAVIAETIRRHLTSTAYILFVVLVAALGMVAATFSQPAAMWPSLVSLLSIITGSALIGPEFSSGALQLVVVKPIRRSTYVVSRATGVFVSVAIVAIAGALSETAIRLLLGSRSLDRIAIAFANALVTAILAIALLAFLGSLTRAYFNAAIYVGTQAVFSVTEAVLGVVRVRGPVGAFLNAHQEIERGLAAIDDALFPTAPLGVDALWVGRVLAIAAVAIVLACVAFSRREVPYAAD